MSSTPKNYDYSLYFIDSASPFMRAIVDLHDYVFMFLVGILVVVMYVMYIIVRDNNILISASSNIKSSYFINLNSLNDKISIFNPFFYLTFLIFLYKNIFKNIFNKCLIYYYDIFIGSRVFYYFEYLNRANFKSLLDHLIFKFLKIHIRLREESELNNVFGNLRQRLSFGETSLVIISDLYVKFFNLPWFLLNFFGSSFTQFYLFQNFIINSKNQTSNFNDLLKFIYAYQFRVSTINSYKFVHNDVLETAWTILPSFILVLIAIPSLLVLFALDEVGKPVLTVKAIGHQWYWSYEITYTSFNNETKTWNFDSYMTASADLVLGQHRTLEVDNTLYLPVNTHVRVLATSMDVIHSWAVPALGVKIDAIPGRLNQAGLFIDRFGVFYGQCSEICGTNHAFMPIRIHVLSNFDLWLTKFLNSVE